MFHFVINSVIALTKIQEGIDLPSCTNFILKGPSEKRYLVET